MTPQERDLILEVAQRLRGTRLSEKDPEADRLIRAEVGSQPDALYLLTQAVVVQEQGLRHAQERIRELEAARGQGGGAPGRGGFLAGLTGGAPAGALPPAAAAPGPASPAGASGVGSFLRTAAAAAAGVVGGQLIFDGMRRLFGGGPGLPWSGGAAAAMPNAPSFGRAFGGQGGGEAYPAAPGRHRGRSDPWQADEDRPAGGDFAGAGGDFGDDSGASGGDFGEADEDESSDLTGAGGDFDDPGDAAGGDFGSDDFGDDSAGGGGDF
jgi:hypothetical protein